jgi:hypothetical protein
MTRIIEETKDTLGGKTDAPAFRRVYQIQTGQKSTQAYSRTTVPIGCNLCGHRRVTSRRGAIGERGVQVLQQQDASMG